MAHISPILRSPLTRWTVFSVTTTLVDTSTFPSQSTRSPCSSDGTNQPANPLFCPSLTPPTLLYPSPTTPPHSHPTACRPPSPRTYSTSLAPPSNHTPWATKP